MNQRPDDADIPAEPTPADDPPSGGYQRQMSVSVGPEDLSEPQAEVAANIVVSARAREHVTRAIAKAFEGGPALEPIAREALVKRITEGMAHMEQDGSSEALRFLVENIARTLERTASGSPQNQAQERLTQAKRLHALAQQGGREAVAKSLDALREMIRDITGMRQKTSLLEDTTASAYSALNSTEHELADLRTHFERLLVMVARHAGDIDPDSARTLDDRSAAATDRLQAAETLIQVLLARGSDQVDDSLDSMTENQDTAALEDELVALRADNERLTNENTALKAEQSTLDEVRWALESAQDEARSLREQLAGDGRQQALDEAAAEIKELRQGLEAAQLRDQNRDQELTKAQQAAAEAHSATEAMHEELAALRRVGDEVEALRQQTADIPRLESELAAAQAAAGEVASQQVRIRSLEQDLAQAREQLTAAGADHQSAAEQARKLVEAQDLVQRLAADQQQLEERVRELIIERDALKAQVKARIAAAEAQDDQDSSERLQQELAQQAEQVATLRSAVEQAEATRDELQQRLETALAIGEDGTARQQALETERDEARLALGTTRADLERLEAERDQLAAERDALLKRIEEETEERLEASAKDFIDQSERLRELTATHESLSAEHAQVCTDLDSARAALEAAQQQAADAAQLRQDLDSSTAAQDDLRQRLEAAEQSVADGQAAIAGLNKERDDLQQRLMVLEQEGSAAHKTLDAQLQQDQEAIAELRKQLAEVQAERDRLDEELSRSRTEINALNGDLKLARAGHQAEEERIDILTKDLSDAQERLNAADTAHQQAVEEADALRQRCTELEQAAAAATAEQEQLRNDLEQRIAALDGDLDVMRDQLTGSEAARAQAEQALDEQQQRCRSLEEASAAAEAERSQAQAGLEERITSLSSDLDTARDQLCAAEAAQRHSEEALAEAQARHAAMAEEQAASAARLESSEQERATIATELEQERAACAALREELAATRQAAEDATQKCVTITEDVAAHAALIERLKRAEAEAATSLKAMHQQLSQVEEERLEAVRAYERALDNAQHEAAQAASREDDLSTALEALAGTIIRLAEAASLALTAIADGGTELGERIDVVSPDVDSGPLVDATASLGTLGRALVEHAQAAAARQLDEAALYRDIAGANERWRGAQDVLMTLASRHGETLELAAEAEQTIREIEERLAGLEGTLREREATIQSLEQGLAAQNQRCQDAEHSRDGLSQDLDQVRAALTAAESTLAEQQQQAQAEQARLEERIAALTADSQALDQQRTELQQQLTDRQQHLATQQGLAQAALAGLRRLMEPIASTLATTDGPLRALADTATALRDAWPESMDAPAIDQVSEELRTLIDGLASQALADHRNGLELSEQLSALRQQAQELSSALEEALREQRDTAATLSHVRQQLSELEERHGALETTRQQQDEELHSLHQETSGLRVQCQHLSEELATVQAIADRVPGLEQTLDQANNTVADQQRQHEDDHAALNSIIAALKQLGLLANERFDHLGLEFTGDARQFSRSTMRWTQRLEDSDESAKTTADYGCHLITRISGQLQSFHDELEHTRRQRIDLESSVRDLQQQVDQQQQTAQDLTERLEQAQTLIEQQRHNLSTVESEKNTLHERIVALEAAGDVAATAHEQAQRQWQASLDEQIASHQAAADHLQAACDDARATLEQRSAELAALRQELDAVSERASAAEAQAAHQIDELRQTVRRRDDDMARQAAEIDQLKEQRLEAIGLQARISSLNNKLNEATKARSLLENQLERLNEASQPEHDEARKREQQQLVDLQSRLRASERHLAEERARLTSLQKSRDRQTKDWQARLAAQGAELEQAQEAHEAALAQIRTLKRDITGLKARIKALEST